MSQYLVIVADRVGEFTRAYAADFNGAVEAGCDFARRYPCKTLVLYNVEQSDAGYDGLTEDERYGFEDATEAARLAVAS